jgi:hypothetical protein
MGALHLHFYEEEGYVREVEMVTSRVQCILKCLVEWSCRVQRWTAIKINQTPYNGIKVYWFSGKKEKG